MRISKEIIARGFGGGTTPPYSHELATSRDSRVLKKGKSGCDESVGIGASLSPAWMEMKVGAEQRRGGGAKMLRVSECLPSKS